MSPSESKNNGIWPELAPDDIGEVPSPAVTVVPARHNRPHEADEAYPAIAQLNDRWRVINCRDDLQWILQKFEGKRWRGNSYHRDRAVLIERIASRCGDVDASALEVVLALP